MKGKAANKVMGSGRDFVRNLYILATALDYIEANLCESVRIESVARACYSSVSGLQKLFNRVFHCAVSEYIAKRRMTAAAGVLVTTDKSVMEIAFDYQYGSPEAFSRGFKKVWGLSPAKFRAERRFTGLFPKFELDYENGGFVMPTRRKVDISALYDVLKELGGTWILCADMRGLMHINDHYGHGAGDLALAEIAARLDRETPEDMLVFRVGADEFAVVTGYKTECETKELGEKIKAHNGEAIIWEGQKVPVSITTAAMRIPEGALKYEALFKGMMASIDEAKTRAASSPK